MNARRLWAGAVPLVLVVALSASVAAGAGGRPGLDLSYGHEGVARVQFTPPPSDGIERSEAPRLETKGFAGAVDGSAYVVIDAFNCSRGDCKNGPSLIRFTPDGEHDLAFAGDGKMELPAGAKGFGVLADGAGRAIVSFVEGSRLVLERVGTDGTPDRSFGDAGMVTLDCRCSGFPQVRLLASRGGGIVLDVNSYTFAGKKALGAQAQLLRFLPDGRPDPSYGTDGRAVARLRRKELPRAVTVGPDGAVFIGGSGGPRQIYLQRVAPDGRLDARFERNAAHSVRRLSAFGEFPGIGGIMPRAGGAVAVIGSSQARAGFELRLRRDGRLAKGFGRRGAVRLPFTVESAIAGTQGAIFGVGETKPYGAYRAFRVLADGRPDPAFGGKAGLNVPLAGSPARVTPGPPGMPYVTDHGRFWCRSYCPTEPGLARYVE